MKKPFTFRLLRNVHLHFQERTSQSNSYIYHCQAGVQLLTLVGVECKQQQVLANIQYICLPLPWLKQPQTGTTNTFSLGFCPKFQGH